MWYYVQKMRKKRIVSRHTIVLIQATHELQIKPFISPPPVYGVCTYPLRFRVVLNEIIQNIYVDPKL